MSGAASNGQPVLPGRLIGVGVGPGDPELLTLKALKALKAADVVAHFAKHGRSGNARAIVETHLEPRTRLLPLLYPVTTEIHRHDAAYQAAIDDFFDRSAEAVAAEIDRGATVAVLSEGDPFFYGSYMHLHVRLAPRYAVEVIPGVTGMSGCWTLASAPIAQGDDVLSIVPGTLDEAELTRRFREADAAVVMKLGRNLPKVRRALAAAGRLERAVYVERGTMPTQVFQPLCQKPDDIAPYFAVVLVPGWERSVTANLSGPGELPGLVPPPAALWAAK